ncbi:HEPN domain-containing protein [Larkinella soli]|uniref:HEPN domain-containing protein n=1 Tax=Larkinella soli TaxID=1770527 RepID=UPI0013E3E3D1|nr:HEPN domain-containing protein [Larkinella soli]
MLHQTAEFALNAFLTERLGFKQYTHHLRKLLRDTRRFTPAFHSLFPDETPEEQALLDLLQQAYRNARYLDGFAPDPGQVRTLFDRVAGLSAVVVDEAGRAKPDGRNIAVSIDAVGLPDVLR